MNNITIEYPLRDATSAGPKYGVYENSTYPRSDAGLSGHPRRELLGAFKTLEEARQAFPEAKVSAAAL